MEKEDARWAIACLNGYALTGHSFSVAAVQRFCHRPSILSVFGFVPRVTFAGVEPLRARSLSGSRKSSPDLSTNCTRGFLVIFHSLDFPSQKVF